MPIQDMGQSPFLSILDLEFSPESVAKQLRQLNQRKACGSDELPARVLREISQSASIWLAFIFQQSYNCSMVPSD